MRTTLGDLPLRLWRNMSMGEAHDYLRARRTRREFLKGVAGAGAAAAAGPLFWVQAARAADPTPVGLHVNLGNDAMTEITVSWSTSGGMVASPRLEIGPHQYLGKMFVGDTCAVAGHPTQYHHVPVTGLAPGTTYHYRAFHGDAGSVTGTFTTAPSSNVPFRFAAMGDMGVNADAAAITSRIVAAQPDCVFMVGDLCYADRLGGAVGPPPEYQDTPLQDLSLWDAWFAQIQASASRVPWIPAVGNHEMEVGQGELGYDGFHARIVLPGSGSPLCSSLHPPTYYATRWSNVAFVALDANDVSYEIPRNQGYTDREQNVWLADTLARLRGDSTIDFIVVGFHHCMYCSNTVHASDGGVRAEWGSLFDQYQVDLVINGHNHSYERTHALRNGQVTQLAPIGSEIDPRQHGTLYVTAGAGGQAAYPSTLYPASYVTAPDGTRVPETADWSAVRYLGDHSLLVVDVVPSAGSNPARMDVVALAKNGITEVDRFAIVAPKRRLIGL